MSEQELFIQQFPLILGVAIGALFIGIWFIEKRRDRAERREERYEQRRREEEQLELARQAAEAEAKQREEDREKAEYERYSARKREDEQQLRREAGMGSGGYIVIDLEGEHRRLFHDLLKGFEEFAKLRGYDVEFSIDSTSAERIAFKFTVMNPEIVVGADRVRQDLRDYLAKVQSGEPLDDIPVVISQKEHDLVLTTLKNRVSFLQHSYNLEKNARLFYEKTMRAAKQMTPLPAQSVVVQTGGALTSSSYSALNSPQALVGPDNQASQLTIASSFNQHMEQISNIETVLKCLEADEQRDSESAKTADRLLRNIKEEIEESARPDPSRIQKWLQDARNALQTGSLGHATVEASKKLFELFGLS